LEIDDARFQQGILYTVTIQTMVFSSGGYIFSTIEDLIDSPQKQSMRTLPPPIMNLEIFKTKQLSRSIDIRITASATKQTGPIYNLIQIDLWRLQADGKISTNS
jgi:hypothetical protein